MKTIVLLTFYLTFLTSCSQFTYVQINSMKKGMTVAEVNESVSKEPEAEFDISLKSTPTKKYFVQVYILFGGAYKSDYFAVYENGKLFYWGHEYEFNRHPDATLNEIGRTAVAEYEKIK
ncbi:MAG TPA: hypothetical protein PLW09_16210 [Candidatus Kapabacteria bacterium]|nr:hypothetical protein [Candidatus Kapabacteria bacterium]